MKLGILFPSIFFLKIHRYKINTFVFEDSGNIHTDISIVFAPFTSYLVCAINLIHAVISVFNCLKTHIPAVRDNALNPGPAWRELLHEDDPGECGSECRYVLDRPRRAILCSYSRVPLLLHSNIRVQSMFLPHIHAPGTCGQETSLYRPG